MGNKEVLVGGTKRYWWGGDKEVLVGTGEVLMGRTKRY